MWLTPSRFFTMMRNRRMNNEVKMDAKFVKAQHYNSNPNHDAQW